VGGQAVEPEPENVGAAFPGLAVETAVGVAHADSCRAKANRVTAAFGDHRTAAGGDWTVVEGGHVDVEVCAVAVGGAVAHAVAEARHMVLAAVVHEADAPGVDVGLRELAVVRHRLPVGTHQSLQDAVGRHRGERVDGLGGRHHHRHVVSRIRRTAVIGPRYLVREHGARQAVAAVGCADVALVP
jgi:hypothetical protein